MAKEIFERCDVVDAGWWTGRHLLRDFCFTDILACNPGGRMLSHIAWSWLPSHVFPFYFVGSEIVINKIAFVHTPCRCGGERQWFCCPACVRRVQKLYRPPRLAGLSVEEM